MAGNHVQLGRQAEHREAEDRMLISLNSKSQPVGKLDIYLLRGSAHIQSTAIRAKRVSVHLGSKVQMDESVQSNQKKRKNYCSCVSVCAEIP